MKLNNTALNERIVSALLKKGFMDEAKFRESFGGEDLKSMNLVESLISRNLVKEMDLVEVMSAEVGMPPLDLTRLFIEKRIAKTIPERISSRHNVLVVAKTGDSVTLAVGDPTDIVAIDDVKASTACNVVPVLAAWSSIKETIRKTLGKGEDFSAIIGEQRESEVEVLGEQKEIDAEEMVEESRAAPIVKIVDLVIAEALKKRASDIHLEPQERSLRVRYRVDGRLQEAFDLPKNNQNAVLARLKIMSGMDITETRVPQDGRFKIKLDEKEVDFRVSALPLIFGNKIVMRALDRSNLSVGLETLGFLPQPLEDFKKALSRPYGIILVTGPTGSGKSTTLYSVLSEINQPKRNIITIEDPVEYQLGGITQIAVNPEIGLTFASGLRSLLRQSPDVIMVGEIRDFETADIAIKASLTGQMVLSTLHTNDAVGAITRLTNMGIEPFLISSSLIMSCAQRLLRKICPHCRREAEIPDDIIEGLRKEYPEAREVDTFYAGGGCSRCGGTGYMGRMGTLETLLVDDVVRELIVNKRPAEEFREYLNSKGARTLRQNAMVKFIKGWTTLEEVMRVT
ncbi:MAG: type II secretion system protein GspE [Candidatus Omnitrophica bacterium]|nr:type II secretion system protein GspE [Candidatus Omnitrophota bacterium]